MTDSAGHNRGGAVLADRGVVSQWVAGDVDELKEAFRKFDIEAIRVAPGTGMTRTTTVAAATFAFTVCRVGFSTLTWSRTPDDEVRIPLIGSAPVGSRWCEIDLQPGAVMVYGPAAEHTAHNMPGLELMVAAIKLERLEALARDLGTRFEPPARGEVRLLAPSSVGAETVRRAWSSYGAVASTDIVPSMRLQDDVLRAALHATTSQDCTRRVGSAKRIDSRNVTRACIDYAVSIGRIPSISELCTISHVSERRLREAFTAEYDVPPSRFFRAWALAEAHRQLLSGKLEIPKVTCVALDLGFQHLGRFSAQYKEIFGETPSRTLLSASR